MCNVSNQARSRTEDAYNKPWRPLPAGRVSESQALVLRWVTVLLAFLSSSVYGGALTFTTLGLFILTFAHDELGFSGYHITKTLCNAGGYVAFAVGATKLVGM